MAIPVDIDSLKDDDIVIKSTPQDRSSEPEPDDKPADKPADEKPADKPADEKPTDKPDDEKPADKPADEPADEPQNDFDWEKLSEDVGIELENDDDVIASLKELAGYKSLSPALQKAIDIERNNGDVAGYFKALSNDPAKLSDQDALWEQYVTANPKLASGNPKLARMNFERTVGKEYSLLTEYESLSASEQEDFLEEHKAEIEYLKEKRSFDAESARASLQEQREKVSFKDNKSIPDEKTVKQLMAAHEAGYKAAVAEFDVVTLKMGKDFSFNVGINDGNKKQVNEWMKNPEKFLNELGFSDGKIDYDTLAGWAALISDIKYGSFGDRLRQALIDSKDISTLESTLDAPGIGKSHVDKPALKGDSWDDVGDAFEKQRAERQKRR